MVILGFTPDWYEIDVTRIDVLLMPEPELDPGLTDVLLVTEPGLAFDRDRIDRVTVGVLNDVLLATEPGLAFERDRIVWVADERKLD